MSIGRPLLALSALALVIAACTKNESESVARPATFKIWGKDFTIRPIAEASSEAQGLGHAVAQVRYIEGGSGTGFFISPDGLFLTNEHILPRERCTDKGCRGVQIIRHLTAGGDIEVFNKFTVLLQSKDLDIALAKVEIPQGQSVPFLKLHPNDFSQHTHFKDPLTVLGHPSGSTLRATEVDFKGVNRDNFMFAGPVFWGNSGSPVVDLATGRAVAIVSKLDFGAGSIDREGVLSITTEAVRVDAAVRAIRALYPAASVASFRAADFTADRRAAVYPKGLLPERSEDFPAKSEISLDGFISQYFASPDEAAGLEKLLTKLKGHYRSFEAFENAVFAMSTVGLRSGRKINLKPEQADQMAIALGSSESNADSEDRRGALLLFGVLSARTSTDDCLRDSLILHNPTWAPQFCRAPASLDRLDIMTRLAELRDLLLDPEDVNYQRRLRFYMTTLQQRLDTAPLARAEDLSAALDYLSRVARDSNKVSYAFRAETLHALLSKDPALVGHSSFQSSF